METLAIWQEALISSWGQVWNSFLNVLASLLGAVVVFIVGLILAYWVKKITVEFLKLIKVDKLSKDYGMEDFLRKADIKPSFIDLIGTVFEWIVILVFFLAAVDILGLDGISRVLLGVLSYIPNIVAAALILAFGYLIAGVVDGLVRSALMSVDHDIAKPLGSFTRWLIIVIAAFAAIDQLKIAQGLVDVFYQGLTYTVVLSIGLAVGLGSKDVVAKILNDWYEKIKK